MGRSLNLRSSVFSPTDPCREHLWCKIWIQSLCPHSQLSQGPTLSSSHHSLAAFGSASGSELGRSGGAASNSCSPAPAAKLHRRLVGGTSELCSLWQYVTRRGLEDQGLVLGSLVRLRPQFAVKSVRSWHFHKRGIEFLRKPKVGTSYRALEAVSCRLKPVGSREERKKRKPSSRWGKLCGEHLFVKQLHYDWMHLNIWVMGKKSKRMSLGSLLM